MKNVSIQLDKSAPEPLYSQIAAALAQAIESGHLPPETKLPSIRSLARQLAVNTVTVVAAYRHLEQQGYAWTRQGSGTYVRWAPPAETTRQIFVPHQGINFASATPTPDIFPVADFKRLLNTVLDRDGGHAFGYQESQGWLPLRQALASYLANNGIEAPVENIHVISGAQQGIDLAAKILVSHGDEVMVESPTYHGAMASFRSRGARILAVPLEEDGPDLKTLTGILGRHRPRLFYAMPHYQNPTGYTWSEQKKQALLDLAEDHDFYIIEDDCLRELSFTGQSNTPLKAKDRRDKVLYIKSFSKILMPGLRLGLLLVPPALNKAAESAKQHSDISSSGLLQRTLELYLREQIWQKHVEYMKDIYADRYRVITETIREHLGGVEYSLPGGGLHLWLRLPAGLTGDQLHASCLKRDVLITPGSFFTPSASCDRFFRMSFAAVHSTDIARGVEIIGTELKHLQAPKRVQPLL